MLKPVIDTRTKASSSEADDLKVNKIESPPRLLPTVNDELDPEAGEAYGGSGVAPTGEFDKDALRADIVAALKTVYDPEIPLNIYDLGLIYGFEIDDQARVEIQMTLTAPACPVAGMLVQQVAETVGDVAGVNTSHVSLTWDPPWSRERMSEEALLELGLL